MTPLGWIFMTLSLSFVVGLVSWCYYMLLRGDGSSEPPEQD